MCLAGKDVSFHPYFPLSSTIGIDGSINKNTIYGIFSPTLQFSTTVPSPQALKTKTKTNNFAKVTSFVQHLVGGAQKILK